MQQIKPQRRRLPKKKWPAELIFLDKRHGLHALLYLLLRQVVQVIHQRPGVAAAATVAACWGPYRALRALVWRR
jgi:hypothetical protein